MLVWCGWRCYCRLLLHIMILLCTQHIIHLFIIENLLHVSVVLFNSRDFGYFNAIYEHRYLTNETVQIGNWH